MYIFRYTPATFGSLLVIYPSGCWPLGNITNKFLTAGVYLTYPPLGHGLYITYVTLVINAVLGLPVNRVKRIFSGLE